MVKGWGGWPDGGLGWLALWGVWVAGLVWMGVANGRAYWVGGMTGRVGVGWVGCCRAAWGGGWLCTFKQPKMVLYGGGRIGNLEKS